MIGAFLMGTYMLIVAILTAKYPPDPDAGLTSHSIASLTMIYLEASKSYLRFVKLHAPFSLQKSNGVPILQSFP